MIRTRLLVPHAKDCAAVKSVNDGLWNSPWFWSTYPERVSQHDHRDSIGRLRKDGGGCRWVNLICNSTSCEARLAVCVADVEKAVFKAQEETE